MSAFETVQEDAFHKYHWNSATYLLHAILDLFFCVLLSKHTSETIK